MTDLPFYKETAEPFVPQGDPNSSPRVEQISKALDKLTAANVALWNRLQRNTPVVYRLAGSVVYSTSAALDIINFGSPDRGTFWEIQNFAIGGTDINVTAAGTFGLYVSGYNGTGVSPGMAALVDGANSTAGGTAAMPFTQTYGSRQIVVNDAEQLFVIIYNGTNNQQYVANVSATVWNVAAGSGIDINAI